MRDLSEIIEVHNILEDKVEQLNEELYMVTLDVVGIIKNEMEKLDEIAYIVFFVNGRTGDIKVQTQLYTDNNPHNITGEELYDWLKLKEIRIRGAERRSIIRVTSLYGFNQMDNLDFSTEEYRRWDYDFEKGRHRLVYEFKQYFVFSAYSEVEKEIKIYFYNLRHEVKLSEDNSKHYLTLLERIKNHPKIRLLIITS